MTFQTYKTYFESILNFTITAEPYNSEEYLTYTKLNYARQNRWLKKGVIQNEYIDVILAINTPQEWIIISEPWCGDAAQIVPFIIKLASYNSLIKVNIQIRDQNSEIDDYLTNGKKSIPKLIVRENNKDIFNWGPRPIGAQEVVNSLVNQHADFHEIKEELQKWYNKDEGISIQQEIIDLLIRR
jgi:glutaredoxin-related protein